MVTDTADLANILNFQGYGNPAAKLWFVGGEEGFGGRMSAAEKIDSLRARASWAPIRDMYEAHLELREQGSPIDISTKRAGSIGVWLWMSRIALGLDDRPYAGEAARNYVYSAAGLGRSAGTTFLTEVSPIPCAKAGQPHPMVRHLTKMPSADRVSRLRNLRRKSEPLIICYGLGRRQSYSEMLGCRWQPLGLEGDPIFWDPNEAVFLLPFLGNGQMSHLRLGRFLQSAQLRAAWQSRIAV